jgi:hypothetical protein
MRKTLDNEFNPQIYSQYLQVRFDQSSFRCLFDISKDKQHRLYLDEEIEKILANAKKEITDQNI